MTICEQENKSERKKKETQIPRLTLKRIKYITIHIFWKNAYESCRNIWLAPKDLILQLCCFRNDDGLTCTAAICYYFLVHTRYLQKKKEIKKKECWNNSLAIFDLTYVSIWCTYSNHSFLDIFVLVGRKQHNIFRGGHPLYI